MNAICAAEPCPVILNSTCVFYRGANLVYTGILTNDNLQTVIEKIDNKFKNAAIGYIFNNGVVQAISGGPVQLGGLLIQDTTIDSNGFPLTVTGTINAGKFVTIGGTSSQFVKGDGSLDNTSYQTAGNYITALTGDGTASGPGSAVFTLSPISAIYAGTWGSSTQIPQFTLDTKGRITSVSNVAISIPPASLSFTGDVFGSGLTGSPVTLTINNTNPNVYGTITPLKFSVNNRGLITGASPITNLDLDGIYGYTPVPNSRTLTINGTTYDLSADRSWTVSGLPSQTGNAGKYLTTDGTNASWASLPPSGVSAVTASSPLASSGGSTPNITIQQASGSQNGYLSSTDWTTFNSKQSAITLTTTGTSGAATFIANTLNIPQYQAAGTYVTSVGATGPITSSGGTTPTISTSMNTNKLIGRSSVGVGVMEEITIGTGLSLSGGTLSSTGSASPLTTKGDLYTYSTVNDRLPVGTNGQILAANSATATGLEWIPNTANSLTNTTASGTDTYTATVPGITSYTDGECILVRFTNGNTTGCTLNINGLGAVTLYRNNDGPLIGGDIWSGAEMLCIYNSTLNGFQLIGTSPNDLFAYVTNDDSVTITKGQVVYAFGGQGDRMTVKLANNTGDATSARTVGLVMSTSIAPNQKGFIMMQGLLTGLNILPTATYSDGDTLYLGATSGSITNVKPYAPNHLVYVGVVTTASNGSAGRLYVNIQNGYELDELHNVQAQSPALKDTLWYDSAVSPGQWKTASIPTILGYTPLKRVVSSVSINTAAGSATSTDYVYLASGTITITLPSPIGNTNRYTIKNVGTGVISIATTSGTIDGSASPITINVQYVALDIISDGTNWNII